MRPFFLLFFLLLTPFGILADLGGWQRVTPLNGHLQLRDYKIFFVNEQTGWVYENDMLLMTGDGGATWKPMQNSLPTSSPSYSLYQFRDERVWTVTTGGSAFLTEDGGTAWNEMSPGFGGNMTLVENGDLISIYGDSIRISSDKGTSWKIQNSSFFDSLFNADPDYKSYPHLFGVYRVLFINSKDWLVLTLMRSQGLLLLKTKDGGGHWVEDATSPINFLSWGIDYSHSAPYILADGNLMYSNDTGKTWEITPLNLASVSNAKRDSFLFLNSQIGWALGRNPGGAYIYHFGSNIYGNFVYKTADAGKTWEKNTQINSKNIVDLFFLGEEKGWAVDIKGVVFRTQDEGNTWQEFEKQDYPTIKDIYFTSPKVGWAIDDSTLFKTENKGANWERVRTSPNDTFQKISVIGNQIWGIGVGADTIPFLFNQNIDDGRFSKPVLPPFSSPPVDIHFINSSRGLILCQKGELYLTTDAGVTWNQHIFTQKTTIDPRWGGFSMKFLNTGTGWILANYDRGSHQLLKTEDEGKTWQVIQDSKSGPILGFDSFGSPEYAASFDFLSDSLGWLKLIGGFGSIHRFLTRDGGRTWSEDVTIYASTAPGELISAEVQLNVGYNFRNFLNLNNTKPNGSFTGINLQEEIEKVFVYDENNAWALGGGVLYNYSDSGLIKIETKIPSKRRNPFLAVSPNPFNPTTTIRLSLGAVRGVQGAGKDVKISIYGLNGQLVRYWNFPQASVTWRGKDLQGNDVASGTYIVRVKAGKRLTRKRIVLMR